MGILLSTESCLLPSLSGSMTCGQFFKDLFSQVVWKKKVGCTELQMDLETGIPYLEFHCSTPILPQVPGWNSLSRCEISPICSEDCDLPEPVLDFPVFDTGYQADCSSEDYESLVTSPIGEKWFLRRNDFYIPIPALDIDGWKR